jgi:DNA-directed RNA polymerase subunit RPC12/RpoP
MDADRQDVKWSPRVPKWKLRRLYLRVAEGIWDDELIDDVGMTLYLRCRDILVIHRARRERRVTCPRCGRAGRTTLIPRTGGPDDAIRCPACGWEMTWRRYHRTFQRKQLNPGGAVGAFEAYLRRFESAREPKDRMLAIDRVIHEFHYSLRTDPDRATRAAGVNLIVGDLTDVVAFLDELGNLPLPEHLRQRHAEWQRTHASTYWPGLLERRDPPEAR